MSFGLGRKIIVILNTVFNGIKIRKIKIGVRKRVVNDYVSLIFRESL